MFVKTFELATDEAHPDNKRRLETRLLVRDEKGGVYGVTYKWRADNSDADLLASSQTEVIAVRGRDGRARAQSWYYPSRQDCLTCHNTHTSGVLGLKARQLNRAMTYPSGVTDNELRTLSHLRLLNTSVSDAQLRTLPTLAAMTDTSRSIEDRARSYLGCQLLTLPPPRRYGGVLRCPLQHAARQAGTHRRADTHQRGHRSAACHRATRYLALDRLYAHQHQRRYPHAAAGGARPSTLRACSCCATGSRVCRARRYWRRRKSFRKVATFAKPVSVKLASPDPGAQIRYTLDGSIPGPEDTVYSGPITVSGPTVLRARAYKDGMTRSITAESVFIIGQQ